VTGSLGLLPSGPDPVRESHARRQPPDGRLLGPWPEGNPPNVHGVFLSHGRRSPQPVKETLTPGMYPALNRHNSLQSQRRSIPMNTIFQYANELMEIDGSTMALLAFICGFAKWMIRSHLTNSAMVFIMYPFTMLFSMSAYSLFTHFELFTTNKPDQWLMWTIMAGTVGVIVTLGTTALIMKALEGMTLRKKFRPA
jgi:hypothetical protein